MLNSSSWTITDACQSAAARKAFSSLDSVFSLSGKEVSSDKLSNVHRIEIDGIGYYVKRYTKAGKGLRRYAGRSRIRAEWENMLFFHKLGIPAAKVIAYGEEKSFTMMTRGVLITEEVKNTKDLKTMVDEGSPKIQDGKWMSSVLEQVAGITRTLHSKNFIHTDHKWRNILVTQGEKPSCFLIDCPAGEILPSAIAGRKKIKDLACLDKVAKLCLSKTQRVRFFKIYTSSSKLSLKDKQTIESIINFFSK
ncbi:heptose kinase [Endozoicomonas sp. OPT23]|uniref:lipopolysaccharide kinase InaA family protein n=1 Tax=Endozoicomonas sp. OPT23 TaxID=2072845 RepID=UPI00129BC6F3|nr:lipopolysaccharide kinase InaA family protein [Endozoicomonas sp. OPT23]MRI31610.1 heptose kinase [Endozoicomonas sp. OPT23]